MTLEEAIKHCEEIVELKCDEGNEARLQEQDKYANKCIDCAAEYRQLAEWLKELKEYREENNWIPYNEQPPEKEGTYFITTDKNGERDVGEDFFYFRGDGTPCWYLPDNVVAWMPLPQPYRK